MNNVILGLKVKESGIDPTPQRGKHGLSHPVTVCALTSEQEHTKVM